MKKIAAIGEGVITIYRVMLVSVVALVILGTSAFVYGYHLDVRNVESQIISRDVLRCLAPDGEFNLDDYPAMNDNSLLDYCGVKNAGRFYIKAGVSDSKGVLIRTLQQGDSGLQWVRDIYKKFSSSATEKIKIYEPGYYSQNFDIFIVSSGMRSSGKISVEVLSSYEF